MSATRPKTQTSIPFRTHLEQNGAGSGTLKAAQLATLDQQGYLLIEKVIAKDWCRQLQQTFEALFLANREAGSRKKGTRHVEGWLESDPDLLSPLVAHPFLLAAGWHVLQQAFGLSQLHGREPLAGFGAQGLHSDWGYEGEPGQFYIVNSLWLLDDFTAENGATRVVPGSHRQPRQRRQPGADQKHPQEQLIIAPAGSLLIFNGHLWHGGTRNDHSGRPRRVIQCGLVAKTFQHLLTKSRLPEPLTWLGPDHLG